MDPNTTHQHLLKPMTPLYPHLHKSQLCILMVPEGTYSHVVRKWGVAPSLPATSSSPAANTAATTSSLVESSPIKKGGGARGDATSLIRWHSHWYQEVLDRWHMERCRLTHGPALIMLPCGMTSVQCADTMPAGLQRSS